MSIVLVGGVHGVGKTTTIESASIYLNRDILVLKGSVIMARILGVSTEDLPHVPQDARKSARVSMYEELSTATNGVRDCHYCTYSDSGYEFPFATATDIGAAAVAVLIEASADKILERRTRIDRHRPLDMKTIIEQLELERQGAGHASRRLDIPLHIISNDGDPYTASIELAKILDEHVE
jgi:adenylate kinase